MDAQTFLDNFGAIADAPGGVDQLRDLILDLAVRGALVAQRESEGIASQLVEELKAERHRRSPGRRSLREIDPLAVDETPFTVPPTWAWVRLPAVSVDLGQGVPTQPFSYIDVGSIDNQAGAVGETAVLSPAAAPSRARKSVARGSVIYSTVRPYLRNIAVLDRDFDPPAIASTAFAVYTPLPGVLPIWVFHCLRSPYFTSYVETHQKGVAYPAINDRDMSRAPLPLPPTGEQERIVSKVDELMQLCDDLEDCQQARRQVTTHLRSSSLDALTIAETEEDLRAAWSRISTNWEALTDHPDSIDALRQTILQLAVRGRLVEPKPDDEPAGEFLKRARAERDRRRSLKLTRLVDDSADYERGDSALPAGWKWSPLQDLVQFIDYRGKTPKKTESGIPLITAKNIRRGWINREPREFVAEATYSEWMTRGFPQVGDVLFTTEAPLGNAALVDIRDPFALAQRAICFSPYSNLHTPYLMHVLLSPWFAEELSRRATGMTATGIKASKLRLIRVPVPPVAEQQRIAARVDDLLAGCRRLETAQRQRLTSAQSVSEATVRLASS